MRMAYLEKICKFLKFVSLFCVNFPFRSRSFFYSFCHCFLETLKLKNGHRSIFSNLSNWKEEEKKIRSGLQRDS